MSPSPLWPLRSVLCCRRRCVIADASPKCAFHLLSLPLAASGWLGAALRVFVCGGDNRIALCTTLKMRALLSAPPTSFPSPAVRLRFGCMQFSAVWAGGRVGRIGRFEFDGGGLLAIGNPGHGHAI